MDSKASNTDAGTDPPCGTKAAPRLSVVVPTYNEAGNIGLLLERLFETFRRSGLAGEVVVADDESPDGTADVAERVLAGRGRVLRRTGRRGLAPAVVDGFAAAKGDLLCVMDADLSHPPEAVAAMAGALEAGADLAVGSRYVPGGGVEGWPWRRRLFSRAACLAARPLTAVRDATSGFFCLRRSVIEGLALDPSGFKIGLEVFVRGKYNRFVEIPIVFRDRCEGESKLGGGVVLQYFLQLMRLLPAGLRRRRRRG